jgi:hypothetical protein
MKKKTYFLSTITYVLIIGFLLTGCAQKIELKAIKSAKVTDSSIKNIGVSSFKNDFVSQSVQIDSAISNVRVNDKKYFTLVDKKHINKILQEQKLNDSGLVNLINTNISNGLSQIETLVVGAVIVDDLSTSFFKESRTDYDRCIKTYTSKGKTYCEQYRKYNVSCQSNKYNIKTKIKLIKVNDAKIIFADTYTASSKYKHCSDDNYTLPNQKTENSRLAQTIANKLVKDIAPSYVYFTVTLLDDIDVNLTEKQEILFENALEMIEYKRINKANQFLVDLNKQLNSKSYVVLYNLAITEESLGNIEKAYVLLKLAEDISLKTEGIVEEIVMYIYEIENNLSEKIKVKKQL